MELQERYIDFLEKNGKSKNTIKGYSLDLNLFLIWFKDTYGTDFSVLIRENVLEYKEYLKNSLSNKASTINHKLSSLIQLNELLIENKIQVGKVIFKSDFVKIQEPYVAPTKVTENEIKSFMQSILEKENSRNYAVIVFMAYTGVRISEALSIFLNDVNLETGEALIRDGKGEKQRIILLNKKIIRTLKTYLKERTNYLRAEESPYLFISQKNITLHRTTINRLFNKYSKIITPHDLRNYFCTHALENDFAIHEVAYMAGHKSINTTKGYTNPTKMKMKEKLDKL